MFSFYMYHVMSSFKRLMKHFLCSQKQNKERTKNQKKKILWKTEQEGEIQSEIVSKKGRIKWGSWKQNKALTTNLAKAFHTFYAFYTKTSILNHLWVKKSLSNHFWVGWIFHYFNQNYHWSWDPTTNLICYTQNLKKFHNVQNHGMNYGIIQLILKWECGL